MTRNDLAATLISYQGQRGFLGSVADQLAHRGRLSDKQWEAVERVLAEQAAQPAAPTTDGGQSLTPGVYRKDGEVFVVKPTRPHPVTGDTHLYAKRLVEISGERVTEEGVTVGFEMVYAPGVIRTLAEADRLPLAEAQRLAIRYRRCINCGARLKARVSVERGIGPVCAKAFARDV